MVRCVCGVVRVVFSHAKNAHKHTYNAFESVAPSATTRNTSKRAQRGVRCVVDDVVVYNRYPNVYTRINAYGPAHLILKRQIAILGITDSEI